MTKHERDLLIAVARKLVQCVGDFTYEERAFIARLSEVVEHEENERQDHIEHAQTRNSI